MLYSEKIALDNIIKEREEIDKFRDIVFKQENLISKLESKNEHLLRKRFESDKNLEEYMSFTKELYVIDPTESALLLNDELSLFKNAYLNMSDHYKSLLKTIRDYRELISELKGERSTLDKNWKEKMKALLNHKEKEFDLNERKQDNFLSSVGEESINELKLTRFGIKKEQHVDLNLNDKCKKNTINYELNEITPVRSERDQIEDWQLTNKLELLSEWRDVVKIVGFSDEEIKDLFHLNNRKTRFGEIVDILTTILIEKNSQIKRLVDENSSLNNEIHRLMDSNSIIKNELSSIKLQLSKANLTLKKRNNSSEQKEKIKNSSFYQTNDTCNNNDSILKTLVGTPSSITINRLNIHASMNNIGTNNFKGYNPNDDISFNDYIKGSSNMSRARLFNFKRYAGKNEAHKSSKCQTENSQGKHSNTEKCIKPEDLNSKNNKGITAKKSLLLSLEQDNRAMKDEFTITKETWETTEKVGTCKSRCNSNMKGRIFKKLNLQSTVSSKMDYIKVRSNL